MHDEKYPLITDRHDPQFLGIRSLQSEIGRQRSGLYLIEGIRHLVRACDENLPLDLLIVEPSILSNPFGQKLVRRLRKAGVKSIRLSAQLYRELTLASEPQGVGAVLRQRWSSLNQLKESRNSLWLVIESVDQPGNLGTMLRTAEAAGVSGVSLIGTGCDPWDPACVRASMGALFSQKLIRCTVRECADWARRAGVSLVGSSPRGLLNYKSLHCRWPAALLIGNEKQGLSPELMDTCNFVVRIPMRDGCDSVNAAVASGVLLFELSSQMPHSRTARLEPKRP